jgi:hypothetical protein
MVESRPQWSVVTEIVLIGEILANAFHRRANGIAGFQIDDPPPLSVARDSTVG